MNNVNQEVGKYLGTLCKYFNEQQSQKKKKKKLLWKNSCTKQSDFRILTGKMNTQFIRNFLELS